jgi:hypothetical protein
MGARHLRVGYGQRACVAMVCAAILVCMTARLAADVVAVRFPEGVTHGFLALSTLDGDRLADGDLIQRVHGTLVTSRLTFRFLDGSAFDETSVFTQHRQFRLLRDHLVLKGPTFPHPLDMTLDTQTGVIAVKYSDDDGGRKK